MSIAEWRRIQRRGHVDQRERGVRLEVEVLLPGELELAAEDVAGPLDAGVDVAAHALDDTRGLLPRHASLLPGVSAFLPCCVLMTARRTAGPCRRRHRVFIRHHVDHHRLVGRDGFLQCSRQIGWFLNADADAAHVLGHLGEINVEKAPDVAALLVRQSLVGAVDQRDFLIERAVVVDHQHDVDAVTRRASAVDLDPELRQLATAVNERLGHPGHRAHLLQHADRLEAREIAPRERHPLILGTFADLAPGEAFVLVNDHDPKPLYYQFSFERAGTFTWTYLEEGPEVGDMTQELERELRESEELQQLMLERIQSMLSGEELTFLAMLKEVTACDLSPASQSGHCLPTDWGQT
mgnify:CR=1 FL=1